MRMPRYLSPTSISLWYKDRTEFYLKYLAENRPPRLPQTQPMSVGSAFDAYVKSYLVEKLFGEVRPEFVKATLFEQQVEKHNRDFAIIAGQNCFDQYKSSGALADLMIELELALDEPRFEFTIEGNVTHEGNEGGVPLLGKPDLYFKTKDNVNVVYDWKVNGYCGKRPTSPSKGYIKCRDGWDYTQGKESRGNRNMHKDCHPMVIAGIMVNIAEVMEDVNLTWAEQLTVYGWLLGEEIDSRPIIGIDQLACKPGPNYPLVRVASHRLRVSKGFGTTLYAKCAEIWNQIHDGYIFDMETREDSDAKCKLLDDHYKAFDPNDPLSQWFAEATRDHGYF